MFGLSRKEKNRKLVYRVLTDPAYRKKLSSSPKLALKLKKLTHQNRKEVEKLLNFSRKVTNEIAALADQLLCTIPPSKLTEKKR